MIHSFVFYTKPKCPRDNRKICNSLAKGRKRICIFEQKISGGAGEKSFMGK
jgi:hypothetical protein